MLFCQINLSQLKETYAEFNQKENLNPNSNLLLQ